jgi:hypothetical protein
MNRSHCRPSTSFDTWVLGEGVASADQGPCGYLGSADPGVPVAEDAAVADPDPETAPETIEDSAAPPIDSVVAEVEDTTTGGVDGGPDGVTLDTGSGCDAQAVENTGGSKDDGCGGGPLGSAPWLIALVLPLLRGRQRRRR